MLTALSIRDFVLIDRLDLNFGPGLSVLTGETGAGKSILLDALSLALGARGDAGVVRSGQATAQVTAVFEPALGHASFEALAENDIAHEGQIILRRVQSGDGRSKAFINDTPASVQLLRRVGALLVEIHGQHDDRALVDPNTHRDLLDGFAGLTGNASHVGRLWRAREAAKRARSEHEASMAQAQANADYLSHTLEELRRLAPEPGEEMRLSERRQLMMGAERLAADLDETLSALSGEGTAAARLSVALRKLERQDASAGGVLQPVADAIGRVLAETDEAAVAIEAARASLAFEPYELERIEERLFALRALARKHRMNVDELPALEERLDAEMQALGHAEQRLFAFDAEVEEAARTYADAATQLSAARQEAGGQIDSHVAAELAPLKLERARLTCAIETRSPETGGEAGIDRVAFHVSTNPGTPSGPLLKVASGGELARIILALKVVLAQRGSAPTLVFDEIDTGVGGATAAAIGSRLARLAETLQVLAVTHAPQVAAEAGRHLRILKEDTGAKDAVRTVTRVLPLDDGARREEIARMLAGQTITDEARAAASRLMERRA